MLTRRLLLLLILTSSLSAQDTRPVGPLADGSAIIPTHQMLRPAGHQVEFPGRPVDLKLIDEGATLVVKGMRDLIFISTQDRVIRQTLRVPSGGMSFHGLAVSKDEKRIFVTGSRNLLWVAERIDGLARWLPPIYLPGPGGKGNSAPGGIWLEDESRLYVTLSRNNTVGRVDLRMWALVQEIKVGVAPYTIVPCGDIACVSNWGGRHPRKGETTDPSSRTRTLVDPVTNVASSGTVSLIDIKKRKSIVELQVGLHPCGLAADPELGRVYVSNANSDTVSVINVNSRKVQATFPVRPLKDLPFGSSPNALLLSADGKRLFVANGANNAVAVLNAREAGAIAGFLPTGWYPGGLALDEKRGWLHVANVKGVGSRHPPTGRSGLNSHNHRGSVSMITNLSDAALEAGTEVVSRTNRFDSLARHVEPADPAARPIPVPVRHGEPSVFEHVLYIIKENRTYDQVLGDQPQGNGDPSLCIFGRKVTPNHHALTDEFVLLDNFYCSGVLSADGHQWTNEAFVTDYLEKMFGGFTRSYPYDGDDPLAYAPTGFLWDNALRHKKTFRCYGEMVQAQISPKGTFKEIYDDFLKGTGKFEIRATSHIDAIRANMCETFIGFPGVVSDVYRAAQFTEELKGFEKTGNLPNFMIMLLPNDHTVGTRPGMPTPEAAVADNDLALGRIVEAVSQSRFWPKTCILVVQDDPQAGWDHVDGHRTVAMVISPYTKRKTTISTRYAQPDMVKTIELILGLPPMNQMDLLGTSMSDCFTTTPDLTPYECRENQIPLDQLNARLDQLKGPARRDALVSLELNLDEIDNADENTFNRILWHAVKGHDTPYPVEQTNSGRR